MNEYIKQNRASKIAILGMALSAAGQMMLPLHLEGFAVCFAALYIVAEIKKQSYEKRSY